MKIRPIIYNAELSKRTVITKEKVTITVVADDIETFYSEKKYAKASNYELVAGQQIGVI